MPALTNEKHELFAQLLAKGEKQKDAYAKAGYRGDEAAASKLANSEKVRGRVNELLERAAAKAVIDAAWVLEKAAELHEKAMTAGSFAAAKGALELIGKHISVQAFRDQLQHSGRVEFANLSDEELEARIVALTGGKYVPRLTTH